MKNASRFLMLIFLSLLITPAQAQLAKELYKRFDFTVLTRLNDVCSKTNLSLEQQTTLAMRFKNMDSTANAKLSSGATWESVSSNYPDQKTILKNILSSVQYADYVFGAVKNPTLVMLAVRNRNVLHLQQTQIETLLKKTAIPVDQTQDDAPDNSLLEKDQQLIKLMLNKTQWDSLLALIVDNKVSNDLNQIRKINAIHHLTKDTVTAFNQAKQYFISREAESYLAGTNLKKQDSVRKVFDSKKPLMILKSDAAGHKLPTSMLAEVLYAAKAMALSDPQSDSLFNAYKIMAQQKYAYMLLKHVPLNTDKYEDSTIKKVLTADQYELFLPIKYQHTAEKNASKDWAKLDAIGLTKGVDANTVNKENTEYELKLLVANDRISRNKTQENLFAKKDVENAKPALLRKLDEAALSVKISNRAKRDLTW